MVPTCLQLGEQIRKLSRNSHEIINSRSADFAALNGIVEAGDATGDSVPLGSERGALDDRIIVITCGSGPYTSHHVAKDLEIATRSLVSRDHGHTQNPP